MTALPPLMPSDGDRLAARRLVRAAAHGALATRRADGTPFVSLSATATDHEGRPLMLLSQLAEHTRNLAADDRVSLLFEEARERPNPQTKPRVTLVGRARPADDAEARARYLARHPSAALYAGFADFAFFRLEVETAHYVAGFGRAVEMEADVLVAEAAARSLAASEAALLDGFAADPAIDPGLLARRLLKRRGKAWSITGVDADGIDLALKARVHRLPFAEAAAGPEDVLERLRDLMAQAKASE